MLQWQQPCCHYSSCNSCVWELRVEQNGCNPPPPCIYYILSLSLIKWTSFVDVGDLPNHVKYCLSVLSLQWKTIRTPPVRAWGSQNPQQFAPLPLESWACFGLGLLSSVQRCWWGLVAAWGSFFLFNCGYAKFLSIMGLGSEKMAPNYDYTFNAHYLVLLQHWESCCLLGGIRRFV
jgi:hypothetical protein